MSDSVNVRRGVATALVVYIAAVAAGGVVGSVWAWRIVERRAAVFEVSLLGWKFDLSKESAIFMLVMAFALVGSTVHSASSLVSYLGNRRFSTSWTAWYLLRPIIAMALGLLSYVVFRGGFLSTQASAADVNLFGVAAISGLAGLFSKQVTDKLEDVMKVVFASKADADRRDKLAELAVTSLKPHKVDVDHAASVTIHGAGFAKGAVALVGDAERPATEVTDNTLTFALLAEDVAKAGPKEISVKLGTTTAGPLTLTVG